MMKHLWHHKLAWIVVLAIVVRLAFLVAFSATLDFSREGNTIHGSEAYDAYAQNLLQSGVYGRVVGVPDAAIPPVYSYALAIVYGIFGRGFIQVGVFHILLDVLSITLLYDTCRRLFVRRRQHDQNSTFSEAVGALACLFTALYPYLIFQNLTLIDTPFWMFCLHLFVWLVVLLRNQTTLNRQTWLIAIAAGVVLGIATLTRPITPPLAILVAVWFLWRLSFWQSVARLLPVALMSVLILSLWIARNYGVYQAFVPMTTTSGANFWQGNSEWTIPVFEAGYDVQWTAPVGVTREMGERESDAKRFALAFQFLGETWRENPATFARLWWTKFWVHWNPQITPLYNPLPNEKWQLVDERLVIVTADSSITGVTTANVSYSSGGLLDTLGRPIHLLYFGTLLLLAIISVTLAWRDWRDVSLLWFVQISMTLMYVVFHPSTRYRSPSDPLLFVMSAITLATLVMRFTPKNQHE
jgi:4-amino-4-deoxy-L-arabinose transferase-like glycosyltransferase